MWNGQQEEAKFVINELERKGNKVVYLITNEKKEFSIANAVVHTDDDARSGRGATAVNGSKYLPPSADLIADLHHAEALIMTMMNRKLGTEERPLAVDEKKRLYYELLRYWKGVLTEFKPDLIIFPAVPHNVSNFTIYSLASLLGIQTILFQETWVSDRIILQYRYDEMSPKLEAVLKKNNGKVFTVESLSKDLQSYYRKHTDASQDATPFDVKVLASQFDGLKRLRLKIKAVITSLRDFTFFLKFYRYMIRILKSSLKKEYTRVVIHPDLDKSFVYVPLHWQPECTTSPLGGVFADQILMLETLAAGLPEDWVLYVKEHPFQWSVDGVTRFSPMRYEGYYNKISKIKNVYLIPIETDTYELIRRSKAVATVTGRAAVEGVLRNIPALIFGYPWYMGLPGAFRVTNAISCKEVLTLIERGFRINQQDVLRYLWGFGEVTFRGFLEPLGKLNSGQSREESVQNLLHAVEGSVSNVADR